MQPSVSSWLLTLSENAVRLTVETPKVTTTRQKVILDTGSLRTRVYMPTLPTEPSLGNG